MEVFFDIKKLAPLKKAYLKFISELLDKENLPASFACFIDALSKQRFHSQQELTEYIGCNKAHTSRTLLKMQLKGIVRLSSLKNGIELTEKGKSITASLNKLENQFFNLMSEGITASESKAFNSVLDKFIINANKIGGQK